MENGGETGNTGSVCVCVRESVWIKDGVGVGRCKQVNTMKGEEELGEIRSSVIDVA